MRCCANRPNTWMHPTGARRCKKCSCTAGVVHTCGALSSSSFLKDSSSDWRSFRGACHLKKPPVKAPAEAVGKDIRRQTRRHFSAEDNIRIVLDGLRGEDSIAELCRKEGIAQSLYYTWSKEFM
jgi:hypothetical protein